MKTLLRAVCLAALILCLPNGPGSGAFAQSGKPDHTNELWQRAVALMKAGQAEVAVPLLDRLVSIDPDNRAFRLELGYALLQTRRYGRARYHLDRARAGNRNEAQVSVANRLISVADARRIFTGYASVNIRPETNPGKQTDLTSIDIFGLPFAVTRAPRSTSVIVTAGAGARPHLSDTLRFRFAVDTWSRFSNEKILRDNLLSLRAGPIVSFGQGGQAEFGVVARRRWSADALLTDSRGAYASLGVPSGQRLYFLMRGGHEAQEFHDGSIPQDQTTFGVQVNFLASPSLLLRGSVDVARTDAGFSSVAGQKTEVRIGGNRSFPNGLDLRLDLWHRVDKREGPDRLFGVTRRDVITGLEVGISNRDLRVGRFVPELILGADRGRSTISLYEYDNRYINMRLRTEF